jgi:5-methylthioadenosine/S-adenosylhomocysteine deaminase
LAAVAEPGSEVDLLIQHGVLVPVDAARTIIYDGAVAIDDGRIIAIGATDELSARYTGKRSINAHHRAVLPGLVDTHHHFLQNFLKGSRDDLSFPAWVQQVSAPLIKLAVDDYRDGHSDLQRQATRLGCIEALKSGVTTILNMEWATHPAVIDVYAETGIRAVHTLTLTDVDHWQRNGMLLSMAEAWDLSERLLQRCQDTAGGRVIFRYGPACENSASAALLTAVRERADANGVGIHIHIAESKSGWDNIQRLHGTTPVAYLYGLGLLGPDVLGAHCIWLAADDYRILADTGVAVSYTPKCHMKLALGVAPVIRLRSEGVAVALGTDTCAVNDNIDMFEEMRCGLFLQRISNMDALALPAYEALEMATLGGARALGMAGEIGSLEPGKKADLILVNLDGLHLRPINDIVNNLVYAGQGSDVETVLVDGRIVVENGRMCGLNEEDATRQAETYALRRFRQAGIEVSTYYS